MTMEIVVVGGQCTGDADDNGGHSLASQDGPVRRRFGRRGNRLRGRGTCLL